MTLAISDVPGDDPAVIGSGPTVPDPTTLADARAIVAAIVWNCPKRATRVLDDPGNETPKPGDACLRRTRLSDRRATRRRAARRRSARAAAGYECVMLGDRLQGEARDVAAEHARLARELRAQGRRAAILSGGELTVTLRGKGRGGPNQEYALALALHLDGAPGIAALAADTDGTDGGGGRPDDPAGAFVDATTLPAGAGASASIPPRFSPTTILRGFSMGSAICSGPARRSPTSRTSVPSLLTGHED